MTADVKLQVMTEFLYKALEYFEELDDSPEVKKAFMEIVEEKHDSILTPVAEGFYDAAYAAYEELNKKDM